MQTAKNIRDITERYCSEVRSDLCELDNSLMFALPMFSPDEIATLFMVESAAEEEKMGDDEDL